MDETADLQKARALRRAVLGDKYVDSQVADADLTLREFQDPALKADYRWAREVAMHGGGARSSGG